MADTDAEGVRQRKKPVFEMLEKSRTGTSSSTTAEAPATTAELPSDDVRQMPVNPGTPLEVFRILLFALYFVSSCLFIFAAQLIGLPLYFVDKEQYYSWMAMTKQHFGALLTSMTRFWSPTVVRISGDASMEGQLHKTRDGRLECDFPERIVLIANHQIYIDWLYLWWISFTADMHGHIYIMLKQSLKWIPIIGWGMQFYGFIFMARKWADDESRIGHRLQQLRTTHKDETTGKTYWNPMWLLVFPEGTNLSANTRKRSVAWSEKSGTPDLKHALLPRSTGLQACLAALKGSVEWIYDCTIAYETIPEGEYGQDIYTLRSVYFQGRAPKSVNMHWRRFKISDLPVDDKEAMQAWVLARWREKDELLETFKRTGRFPSDELAVTIDAPPPPKPAPVPNEEVVIPMEHFQKTGKWPTKKAEPEPAPAPPAPVERAPYIETQVRPKAWYESFELYVPATATYLVIKNIIRLYNMFGSGELMNLSKRFLQR